MLPASRVLSLPFVVIDDFFGTTSHDGLRTRMCIFFRGHGSGSTMSGKDEIEWREKPSPSCSFARSSLLVPIVTPDCSHKGYEQKRYPVVAASVGLVHVRGGCDNNFCASQVEERLQHAHERIVRPFPTLASLFLRAGG